MPTCDLLEELGAAYVLGALEADAVRDIERHMDSCPACRAVVEAHLAVATSLALAPAQIAPPARLRAGLLAAVRGNEVGHRSPWWRLRVPSPLRMALGAASLASVGFIAALTWGLALSAGFADRLPAASSSGPAAAVDWSADGYLARADMKRLVGTDASPDARGWIYVDPAADSALLVAYRLPPLASDRAYQLWLVSDALRVSGGVFSVDAEGYGWLKVHAPQSLASYQRIGITVEPLVGSPSPTGARVLGGNL